MLVEPRHELLFAMDVLSNFVCMLFAFTQAYSVLLLVYVCMILCQIQFTWADIAV